MRYAVVIGSTVVHVSETEPHAAIIPDDLAVSPAWLYEEGRFIAPPPPAPWQIKMLDGQYPVEALEVVDKHSMPPGVDSKASDSTRVSVITHTGVVEVQNGDWLVRARPDASAAAIEYLKMGDASLIRLPFDQALARLV